jgi:hypothetical protein
MTVCTHREATFSTYNAGNMLKLFLRSHSRLVLRLSGSTQQKLSYPWLLSEHETSRCTSVKYTCKVKVKFTLEQTLSLTSALDEGGWSTPHSSHFTPLKETRYPLYRRLGKPQGRSGWVLKISPPPGFDPRTVQPVASRCTESTRIASVIYTSSNMCSVGKPVTYLCVTMWASNSVKSWNFLGQKSHKTGKVRFSPCIENSISSLTVTHSLLPALAASKPLLFALQLKNIQRSLRK